jgi:hypothetical protein
MLRGMVARPILVLLLVACQAPTGESSGFTTPAITSVSAATTSESSVESTSSGGASTTGSAGETASSGSAGDATTEPMRDLGGTPDMGDLAPFGCQGKIDFLFVISRSGYMEMFQDRLIAAFPAFIATIQSKFADFDYHIMVVDGDADWGLSYCTSDCPVMDCLVGDPCCAQSVNPDTVGKPCCAVPDYPCEFLYLVDECDDAFGAGNVFPAGGGASNEPCPIDDGRRYMIKGQSDLSDTFACAAKVGLSGRGKVGQALTSAMQPEMNDGGCNDGFLRDDALLMVTIIEANPDVEPPFGSDGTPAEWAQAVLDAKHGDPESVVMLHIYDPTCEPYDGICTMIKMFPFWHVEDLYAEDYGAAFDTATGLVETACAGFVPPPG